MAWVLPHRSGEFVSLPGTAPVWTTPSGVQAILTGGTISSVTIDPNLGGKPDPSWCLIASYNMHNNRRNNCWGWPSTNHTRSRVCGIERLWWRLYTGWLRFSCRQNSELCPWPGACYSVGSCARQAVSSKNLTSLPRMLTPMQDYSAHIVLWGSTCWLLVYRTCVSEAIRWHRLGTEA